MTDTQIRAVVVLSALPIFITVLALNIVKAMVDTVSEVSGAIRSGLLHPEGTRWRPVND